MESITPVIPELKKLDITNKITDLSLSLLFRRSEILNEIRYSLLKPECFGIIKISIDDNALRSKVFKISEIECILSNGGAYYHKATAKCNHFVNLDSLDSQESEGAYIFLIVRNDIQLDLPSQFIIKEHLNSELNIFTMDKNVALIVGKTFPHNCSYLPLAKLKLTKNGLELDDYIPPLVNVKSNRKMLDKIENSLHLLHAKFLMVKKDIESNKKELNSKRFHENHIKIKNLNNAIHILKKLLKQESILPTDLYLNMNKVLAYAASLNQNISLPIIEPYEHFTFAAQFDNMMKIMAEILNKEISEKYKLFLFTKKEDFYYLKLPKQNSSAYKIALKKPHKVTASQLIDWMNTALICEKVEYHSMIEKRSLGYERKNEYADIETNLKNDYVFFNVKLLPNQVLSENTLIISQSNTRFSQYEPDEIALYWEMKETA